MKLKQMLAAASKVGGASPGGLEGGGKLTLGKDTKDLRLNLKGKSRTTKKAVEVDFVGK